MYEDAIAALENISKLLPLVSLPLAGHAQVQKDVECIRAALESTPAKAEPVQAG